jgi:RNA polymerase sigma-70 factor (ECF subfamily)
MFSTGESCAAAPSFVPSVLSSLAHAPADWEQIVGLYDVLARVESSAWSRAGTGRSRRRPRARGIISHRGSEPGGSLADAGWTGRGLALVDKILGRGDLAGYQFAYFLRADLRRRLGRKEEAPASFERALGLTQQEPERRFLRRRIEELRGLP